MNPEYVDRITEAGLIFSGRDDRNVRMEIIELPSEVHPFFVATQYHPGKYTVPTTCICDG